MENNNTEIELVQLTGQDGNLAQFQKLLGLDNLLIIVMLKHREPELPPPLKFWRARKLGRSEEMKIQKGDPPSLKLRRARR